MNRFEQVLEVVVEVCLVLLIFLVSLGVGALAL